MRFSVLFAGCAGLAAVGFWKGTPAGVVAQGTTGLAGVVLCLLALRVKGLSQRQVDDVGGPPLYAAGVLATVAVVLGAVDLLHASPTSTALVAGPVAGLVLVLTAVSALRLSTAVDSRRTLQTVALVAFVGAVATTLLYARNLKALPPLPDLGG